MQKRVLIAGLFHETHTFVPGLTELASFRALHGAAMWSAVGDTSPIAGALEVAQECEWDVVPAINLEGGAGPLVADSVVEHFWDALTAALRGVEHIDGVYLSLHGAMVSEQYLDVEGELLRRMRELPILRDVPIGGVLDLHGNLSLAMAEHSQAFLAYRENPHTDAKAVAMDAARLLDRIMCKEMRPITVYEHPPLLLPPTATGTADDPMQALEAQARVIEASYPEILAVNVFAGFSFADVPPAGVSFTAVTVGDPAVAQQALGQLSAIALEQRAMADPQGMALDEALIQVHEHPQGPIVLVEPADNIGGGAPGDLTIVLQGLLDQKIDNAAVTINDPEAVAMLSDLPVGRRTHLSIGGKSGALGASPLHLDIELCMRSDGQFALEDRQSHLAILGSHVDMGPCALVRCAGVMILLTSRPTPPFDLGQWRCVGIQPEALSVIVVKAAVGHRRAYDPMTKASYTLDTPGPCTSNLHLLPFQHVQRPIYPLDREDVT